MVVEVVTDGQYLAKRTDGHWEVRRGEGPFDYIQVVVHNCDYHPGLVEIRDYSEHLGFSLMVAPDQNKVYV